MKTSCRDKRPERKAILGFDNLVLEACFDYVALEAFFDGSLVLIVFWKLFETGTLIIWYWELLEVGFDMVL